MKKVFVFCLALFSINALAGTNEDARALIKRIDARLSVQSAQPLLNFFLTSEPKQGEEVNVFITPAGGYSGAYVLLDAKLSGTDVSLEKPVSNLWVFHGGPYSESRSHTLEIAVSIEDAKESDNIRTAIKQLDKEITALQKLIDKETDPVKKAQLIAERDEKITVKNGLLAALARLKTPVGSQSFTFQVGPADPDSTIFPRLVSVSPNVGPVSGGTEVTLTGVNFASGAEVKFAGIPALNVQVVSASIITAETPAMGTEGVKEIEVRLPLGAGETEQKNAFLRNAFFATNSATGVPNFQPVAVAGAPVSIVLGESATVSGAQSYDPNPLDEFSFSWKILTKPEGSTLPIGTEISNQATANIVPDRAGFFVLELVTRETNTQDLLESLPSLTVVEVKANEPPVVPALFYTIRSQGAPYQVALSTATAPPTDTDGIQSMVWDFGDGTSERTFDPTFAFLLHNYQSTGQFTATLRVRDVFGAESASSIVINVVDTDIPTAKFRVSPASGAVPLTVTFDASESSDSNGITQYRWLFGDGTPEQVTTTPTITHTFQTAANFSVRLRTRDQFFANGESRVTIFAGGSGGTASQAQFLVGPPRQVLLGTPHVFDGSRSFNPNIGGTLAAWNWTFGDFFSCPTDGCTGAGLTASYIYPQTRNFFPGLQVQSGAGTFSQRTFQEVFAVNAGAAPRAIARASAVSGVAPFTVVFDGSESYDYDGTLQHYHWSFGTGDTAIGPSVSYVYATPGVYNAGLSVLDNDGNTTQINTVITVLAANQLTKKEAPQDPEREYERQILANACAAGQGDACYYLGGMYAEDGDLFTKQKLWEMACSLGYQEACLID